MKNSELVYDITSKIPRGKVLTYGALAKKANVSNPRVVGNILHKNNDPENIPCHRVVNSRGRLSCGYAFGGMEIQRKKLEEEGVEFENDTINLNEFLWLD